MPDAIGPAAQIHRRCHQHLVHRQRGTAVAPNAGLFAKRLRQRLAIADADIFDGVMRIDMEIAIGFHGQVDQAVLGQDGKHVVEEADAGSDLSAAGAFKIEAQGNARFGGFAVGRCGTRHGGVALLLLAGG